MTATRPLPTVYVTGAGEDPIETNGAPAPREPVEGIAREASRRSSREPVELGAVIDDFMRSAEGGELEDIYGVQYTPDRLRELHSALSHVKSELGTMRLDSVRRWHVQGMLDELRRVGLAPRRLTAVVDALHSVYSYAIERGIVDDSPVIWLTFPQSVDGPQDPAASPRPRLPEPPVPAPAPAPSEAPTPTQAMLALSGRVLLWTVRIVVTIFVLVAIVLIVEFA